MPAQPPTLTPSQTLRAQAAFLGLRRAREWNGQLPVLLLNRCWLRLTVIPVERLALELPPDLSRAAPELERYRTLIETGHSAWQAQQLCWLEFGAEACQQALRHFWSAQERHPHGWTLERYLGVLAAYRHAFTHDHPRPLPLIVLARPTGPGASPPGLEDHGLFWLRPDLSIGERAMRHTCA
ncbi:MAG: hypothetical protein ACK6AD_15330 [Cyanobacteriota bacterium]